MQTEEPLGQPLRALCGTVGGQEGERASLLPKEGRKALLDHPCHPTPPCVELGLVLWPQVKCLNCTKGIKVADR